MKLPYTLVQTQVEWETPITEEVWLRAEALGEKQEIAVGPEASTTSSDAEVLRLGPTLPSPLLPEVVSIEILRWQNKLRWQVVTMEAAASTSPPPSFLKETDKKVGGAEGLGTFLEESAKADKSTIGRYRIICDIDGKALKCKVLPVEPSRDNPIYIIDSSPKVEQLGYRLSDKPMGLDEFYLVYFHDTEKYRVKAQAMALLEFGHSEAFLPYGRKVSDLLTGTFFTEKD